MGSIYSEAMRARGIVDVRNTTVVDVKHVFGFCPSKNANAK